MIAPLMLAFALAGAGTAAPASGETTIPRMSGFLEWLPDGNQALFIRGDTGRWYRASLAAPCPRLRQGARMRFNASPGNRFDRHSSIRADGWRCMVASVTDSGGPPPRHH